MKQIRSLIAASRFLGRLLAHDGLVAHTHALVVNRLVHAVLPRGPVRPHVGTSRREGHQVPWPCTSKKTRRHDTGEAQGARTESERGPLHHSHTHTHTMQTADSRHQTSDRRGEALVLTEEQALLVHDVGPHADSQARQGSEQRAGERHGEQQQERKRRRLLRK